MSLIEWETFEGTPDVSISLDTVNPIHGLGSMVFHKNPVGFGRNGVVRRNVVGQQYLRSGALRGIFEPRLFTAAALNRVRYGITFLWSADNPDPANNGTGHMYMAGYDTYGLGGGGEWGVWRFHNGLKGAITTIQNGPVASPAIAHGQPFTLDVQWQQDTDEHHGVRIIVNVGTTDDFAGMTEVCDVIDLASSGALMGESFGEGPGYANTAGSNELEFAVDRLGGDAYQGRP